MEMQEFPEGRNDAKQALNEAELGLQLGFYYLETSMMPKKP